MKTMHIFARGYSERSFCGRVFLKCGKETGGLALEAALPPELLYEGEVMCEKCYNSERFQEELALHLLATVGE